MKLRSQHIYRIASGEEACPTASINSTDTKAMKKWQDNDEEALALIHMYISATEKPTIKGANSSFEAWNKLQTAHQHILSTKKFHLREKLMNIRKGPENMEVHLLHIQQMFDQLAFAGEIIGKTDHQAAILKSLPSTTNFDIIKVQTRINAATTSIQQLCAILIEEDITQRFNQTANNFEEQVLQAADSKFCTNCHKNNHNTKKMPQNQVLHLLSASRTLH